MEEFSNKALRLGVGVDELPDDRFPASGKVMVNDVYHIFLALGKCRSRNLFDASDKMVLRDLVTDASKVIRGGSGRIAR